MKGQCLPRAYSSHDTSSEYKGKSNNISIQRSLLESHSMNILLVRGDPMTKLNINKLEKYTLPTLGVGREKILAEQCSNYHTHAHIPVLHHCLHFLSHLPLFVLFKA